MRIVESWPQVDGGTRYLLRARDGTEITLDVVDGKASGFVRGGRIDDRREQRLVNSAARCVRAAH